MNGDIVIYVGEYSNNCLFVCNKHCMDFEQLFDVFTHHSFILLMHFLLTLFYVIWIFELCSVNQPPNAVHCPECNACIIGFDHHCVWMGICIGKNNFTAFVIFNLSWFLYLMYGGLWVSLFSQVILHKHESNT